MTNRDMAATLFNIATLLRDRSDNPYRVRAYFNGARALMRRDSDDMAAALKTAEKTLPHPKGVLGEKIQRKLQELARTGDMALFNELCEGLPPHIGALMRVPGVGPRTAQRLHDTLGIETPAQLVEAARLGRLQTVWGIGPKREAQLATQLSLFDDSDLAHRERLAA
jgi:DNA polymerase (family 10)